MSSYSQIVNSLIQGPDVRWTSYDDYQSNVHYHEALGRPTVVTYSFSQSLQPEMPSPAPQFRPLNDAEKANVRAAMGAWDQASGLVLVEVGAGQGDIKIGAYNFNGTGYANNSGYAFYPGPGIGGDIFFNTNNNITFDLAAHEIGHSLGLKHPFDPGRTGVTLPSDEDKQSNTLMSYTADRQGYNALQSYDVTTIQYLYGANVSREALFPAGYSSDSYMAANPDLLRAFNGDAGAADNHYLLSGMREGRSTKFDALRYLASNADLAQAFGTNEAAATWHYVHAGVNEGRDPRAFNPLAYIASYPDLQTALGTDVRAAEMHYLMGGKAEGRSVTFDPYKYLAANMDVLVINGNDPDKAALHYLTNGRFEGRTSQGLFNPQTYLSLNPDLAAAFGNDLDAATKHFVKYGWQERRNWFAVTASPTVAPRAMELAPSVPAGTEAMFAPQGYQSHEADIVASLQSGTSEFQTSQLNFSSADAQSTTAHSGFCNCPLCTGGGASSSLTFGLQDQPLQVGGHSGAVGFSLFNEHAWNRGGDALSAGIFIS